VRPAPLDSPVLRLFFFHHAGGSHLVYRDWARHFPTDWEICLLEAPGHGRLLRHPLCGTVDELARWAADVVEPLLDRPFGIFGHSLGGMAAYDLARLLQARGGPRPRWLGVSAVRPPDAGPEHVVRRSHLPDPALRQALAEMGGSPPELLEDPQTWALFEKLFRTDFKAAETWRPRLDLPPLQVPTAVYGGNDDPSVGPGLLSGWQRWTTHWLGLRVFPGRHFYFQPDARPLADRIVADIRTAGGG
jgi:surfactin synthase thioesterase subunit